MRSIYKCRQCRAVYPKVGMPYFCPLCGGIYEIDVNADFKLGHINNKLPGIWRYRSVFGIPQTAPVTYLGEGDTPIIQRNIFSKNIIFKLEFLNPTGSYKDRATAVLTSMLKQRNVSNAIEDSSGNAGASFAAYASAFAIDAELYIPASTSGPKRKQIESYGVTVIPIPGSRSKAARSAQAAVTKKGITYASHAFLPFGMAGIATIAYELVEQIGNAPGTIIAPIGHGSLLAGIILGFRVLKESSCIKELPSFVGVQADKCAPVWAKWVGQDFNQTECITIAAGTQIVDPVRGGLIFDLLNKANDQVVKVSEAEIKDAIRKLANQGLYVEPTSALVWAALENNIHNLKEPITLILTGFGLKSDVVV